MDGSAGIKIQLEIHGSGGTKATAVGVISKSANNCMSFQPGLQQYELRLSTSTPESTRTWCAESLELLELCLIVELQKFIDQHLNPRQDHVAVLEDSSGLLELRSGYCQHCKKKIIEYYGFCHGVLKKCDRCGRLTVIKDEAWKAHWNGVLGRQTQAQ
jgi:hypothetical protein